MRHICEVTMKKRIRSLFFAFALLLSLCACGESSPFYPKDPVVLIMWHVYGEQATSPMDDLVEEFNRTVGAEQGVFVSVTNKANSATIGKLLLDAQSGRSGDDMPDLFTANASNAIELGVESLLDWNTVLTEEELSAFVPEFLADGTVGQHLSVLPLSKSTHLLMICGTGFAPFSEATGVRYEDLATWDGFYAAAGKYHDFADHTPFCAMDYPLRSIELHAMEHSDEPVYEGEWYNFENTALKESFLQFARALAQGHVVVSNLYSNTQVMTGSVLSGLGSSAAILYYNDTVTYPDTTSYPMDLHVVPMPMADNGKALMTQAGVGLCAAKTTEQKAEAAALFARWLTEAERNLGFVTASGYMPVKNGSFDHIAEYSLEDPAYEALYDTLNTMHESYTAVSEPNFPGYYERVNRFYDLLRERQASLHERFEAGESADALALELWELFQQA